MESPGTGRPVAAAAPVSGYTLVDMAGVVLVEHSTAMPPPWQAERVVGSPATGLVAAGPSLGRNLVDLACVAPVRLHACRHTACSQPPFLQR